MIVVWFSCGAASAAALKLTINRFPGEEVRAVNNPIAEEHEDNRRFLMDVSEWCGVEIETAAHSDFPSNSCVDVWDARKAMSLTLPRGGSVATCTTVLKREARQQWEAVNSPDWHVLGFTAEEKSRHESFVSRERENVIPVLIDAGMTKSDCGDMVRSAGIDLPKIYDLGFPNANCIGCVKATSPTYWNLVRREFPEEFRSRAEQSRRFGARLVRVGGERIFLDELHPQTRGAPLWQMPPCSLFCEEWNHKAVEAAE